MKVLGISGSHRKQENTYRVLKEALRASETDSEIVEISDLRLKSCRACYDLCSKEPYTCVIKDDLNTIFWKMREVDGIILASPLYSPVLVPSQLAILMERLSCLHFFESVTHNSPQPLSDKLCGIIAVSGGSEPKELLTLLAQFALMLHLNLVTVKRYPYLGVWAKAPVEKDEEGMECAREMGISLRKQFEANWRR
ncbi:MAG: flavodoxin family protein [Theionarchaea archaeon]|nr:flavodoxin family protein [Theionarchaea archaeon]